MAVIVVPCPGADSTSRLPERISARSRIPARPNPWASGPRGRHASAGGRAEIRKEFTSRRFLPNGRRDRSFGESGVWHTNPPGSQSFARAALTQPDGKVVAGGWVQIERFGDNGPGNTAMMLTRYR